MLCSIVPATEMAEVFPSDDESMEVASTETEEESEQMAVTILMTNEQRLAVRFFFGHNGWEYTEADKSVREQDYEDEHLEPGYVIPQDSAAEECIHCLCRPCITSDCNQQMWWETDNQPSHERNATIRKGIYKRFWTMLFHRQVWRDPRYLAKKEETLSQDVNRQFCVWGGGRHHKRDIMPDCVLKLVRSWCPNPATMQYMGHRWG